MRYSLLFTTALTLAGFALTPGVSHAWPKDPVPVTGDSSTGSNYILSENFNSNQAAARLVEHLNYAQVALAMNNGPRAEQHLEQARRITAAIVAANPELRGKPVSKDLRTSRILFNSGNKDSRYHFFPIETGPIEVTKVRKGPFWTKKGGLAVMDAEIIYVTIDLTNARFDYHVDNAEQAIHEGKFNKADSHLARLISELISVNNSIHMPLDKARDNIALARDFVIQKNYAGARYALKHADRALHEMERDSRYKARRNDIIAVRQDIKELQQIIRKDDPTLLDKTEAKLSGWWDHMKEWGN